MQNDAAQIAHNQQVVGSHRPLAGGCVQAGIAGEGKQKSDRRVLSPFVLRLHFHSSDELIATK